MQIIAHRGRTSLVESENTIEAFQAAIDLGISWIEFDLQCTQDGYIVCYHDDRINGRQIKNMTYDRLLAIAKAKGFIVPLFIEVIELCRGKISLDIELKTEGYEDLVVAIVLKHLHYSQFTIKSFNDSSVRKIKSIDHKIKVGLLIGGLPPKTIWHIPIFQIFPEYRIFRSGADFISPNYRLLRFGFLWRMNRIGKEVYIWTVNKETLLTKLIANRQVTAIITDRPELAMQILANAARQ